MIRILEANGELVTEIDAYISLEFERSFYGIGTFVLRIDSRLEKVSELTKNRLILIKNERNKVGIIKQLRYEFSGNNNILEVTGVQLKGLTWQRITIPPTGSATDSYNTDVESVMKGLVQRNCLDITGMEFDELTILTNQNRGNAIKFETRYKRLSNELEAIGRANGIGYDVELQDDWEFDIKIGTDRTSNVFFSRKYENVERLTYLTSLINTSNYILIGVQGTGASRTIVEDGIASNGLERNVRFVDARDISDTDVLQERLDQKLAEYDGIDNLDIDVTNSTFVYETDWDLGDYVTFMDDFLEIEATYQIEIVKEWYTQQGEKQITIGFGKKPITIRDYVNQRTEQGIQ